MVTFVRPEPVPLGAAVDPIAAMPIGGKQTTITSPAPPDTIKARTPIEQAVLTSLAGNAIGTSTAGDRVFPGPTIDMVVASSTRDHVLTDPTTDQVVTT